MKIKIVRVLVMMLLIATAVPAVSLTTHALTLFKRNEQQKNHIFFDTNLSHKRSLRKFLRTSERNWVLHFC